MRGKRRIAFVLALLLTASALITIPRLHSAQPIHAATNTGGYFYRQLNSDDARAFYHAMENMYQQGIFKTGTGSYELTGSANLLSQDTVKSYMDGLDPKKDLLAVYGAARDAFYMDHPDIFYVDFSNLTVRATSGKDGYHVYLGAGRTENYYTQGFSSESQVDAAIAEFDAVVKQVIAGAESAEAVQQEEGVYRTKEQVKYVHDYITNHTSYRLENKCAPENVGFIRTAYGALVKHEGVCESYTRAMKTILDHMNIPCIMVQGVYQHSEDVFELHIWDYVQLDGKWYAVDATMDDPINSKAASSTGVDGYETTEYLLAGKTKMNEHHMPSSILSEAKYEFSYPELSIDDFGVDVTEYDDGLVVKYKREGISDENIPAGEYWISYQGKGYAAAAKDGHYMLCRFYTAKDRASDDPNDWTAGDWAYITPELYPAMEDTDDCLHLSFPQIDTKYIEFGVTDIDPGNYMETLEFYYNGSVSHIESATGQLYNPSGQYYAPPYIKTQSPRGTGALTAGQQYHVTVTYTYPLEKVSADTTPGITMTCRSAGNIGTTTGEKYSTLENFKWDDDATVEFDFKPSDMWADNNVYYEFKLTGLVGKESGKEPNSIIYGVKIPCCAICYRSQGIDWNVFGKPTLLDNTDMSMNGWKTADGTSVEDLEALKDRMVLVASTPTQEQTDTMNDMIEEELSSDSHTGKVLKSETYNINLTVCKAQIVQTGQSVRISLGFPEGYGPDDEGVTFKAYHFTRDDNGTIVSVEEIPCTITRYGLVVICNSFSPYAVVAVEDDGTNAAKDKSVIITNTPGGSITDTNGKAIDANMFTLSKENSSRTFKVTAEEGYDIDTIVFNKQAYPVISGTKEQTITIDYDDLKDETAGFLDVKFVAESVQQQEVQKGETAIEPIVQPAAEDYTPFAPVAPIEASIQPLIGSSLTLKPIEAKNGETYQWYKDDEKPDGKTDTSLTFESITKEDYGTYTLCRESAAARSVSGNVVATYILSPDGQSIGGGQGSGSGSSGSSDDQQGSGSGDGQQNSGSGNNDQQNGGSGSDGQQNGGSGNNDQQNGGSGSDGQQNGASGSDGSQSGSSANTSGIELQEDPAKVGETPITGDNNHLIFWLLLMCTGVLTVTAPIRYRGRK